MQGNAAYGTGDTAAALGIEVILTGTMLGIACLAADRMAGRSGDFVYADEIPDLAAIADLELLQPDGLFRAGQFQEVRAFWRINNRGAQAIN